MPSRSDERRSPGEAPDISVEPLKYRAGDLVAEKYRLEELRGQGGMGSVWRARNLALDVDVAVKLIHGDLVSAESTERLQTEAHAAAKLEHPSAVRVFDLGRTELGDPFIVMELLRGESLSELIAREGKIPPVDAVPLLLPVASALAAAHAKGIVHRDLKPDNVVLVTAEDGTVPKIVDFGIAKVDGSNIDRKTTTAGTILGSPDYMSPEQARGEVDLVDGRTDVWSLGVVLYECVAGHAPFVEAHPLALIRAIIEKEPPTLRDVGAADAVLSAIVERAMTKDLSKRFEDMRSFGRALAEWALGAGVETDVTGASIAAHWTRASRHSAVSLNPSLPGAASSTPAGGAPAAPRVVTPSAVIWTPPKPPPSRRRLVAGLAVGAVLLGLVVVFLGGGRGGEGTAPAPAPSAAATGRPPASAAPSGPSAALAPAPASAQAASAPAAPPPEVADPAACVRGLFPAETFEPGAPLGEVCAETDPRRGAALLRAEIARRGVVQRKTTEAMRSWALLSWYELAAFAAVRGRCCPEGSRSPIWAPPSVGTCPALAPILDELGRVAAGSGEVEPAVANFRLSILCVERGHRLNQNLPSPYPYDGPPGGGAQEALLRILERARAR
jgi:serine/threonine-protein kinase